MKAKAESMPNNHVVWANGFKSNMPDWKTARLCACSYRLLFLLREARVLFFQYQTDAVDPIRERSFGDSLHEVLGFAELGIEPDQPLKTQVENVKKAFPKPPGVT